MRLKHLPHAFAGAAAAMVICACGFSEDKAEAVGLADRYFEAAAGPDSAAALALYSPRFFEATSRDDWTKTLRDVRSRCGVPTAHTLKNWTVNSRIGTNAGSYATLIYEVEYTHCRMSETISTFRPDGGERMIIGHHFQLEDASLNGANKTSTIT